MLIKFNEEGINDFLCLSFYHIVTMNKQSHGICISYIQINTYITDFFWSKRMILDISCVVANQELVEPANGDWLANQMQAAVHGEH